MLRRPVEPAGLIGRCWTLRRSGPGMRAREDHADKVSSRRAHHSCPAKNPAHAVGARKLPSLDDSRHHGPHLRRKRVAARLNSSFMDWKPQQYLKFGGQRLRPAHDLLARVTVAAPQHIVDLGCGTGTVTALLRTRWPEAHIVGVDNSKPMLERAQAALASATAHAFCACNGITTGQRARTEMVRR